MPEREDSGFKVTDRRKYNADGSPRDAGELETAPAAAEVEAQSANSEAASNNVVSFPGDAVKKEPPPESLKVEPAPTETKAAEPVQTADQAAASQAEKAYNQTRGTQPSRLPDASFLSLANMLAVEAAMHLGLIQSPGEEPPPPDLEAARHLIDMLGILQTKTRGNLTSEEDNLLENMLADLRMQFVAIARRR